MNSGSGIGQITDTGFGPDKMWTPDSFTAAHELGHGGSLPDEYAERWNRCNQGTAGFTCNTPGDAFVADGAFGDVINSYYGGGPTPYPIMTQSVEMRNRYFWHNAEFARKHLDVAFFAEHGAYADYKLPGNPKFPYRSYAYWPVRKKMNRKGGKHGASDIYLTQLGKDRYSQALIPNGPWDGIISILLKIDLNAPAAVLITDVRDAIRNAIIFFNTQTFFASGSTGVKTDTSIVLRDNTDFTKVEMRFSPRFLLADPAQPAPYGNDYLYWQATVKSHFVATVSDNNGIVAPAKPVVSGFAGKKGGAINFGIDSSKGTWKADLGNDVKALLPDMLGIKLAGAAIAAGDLTPLAAAVIHKNAKVQ
jgi:hypothetical protein